MGQEGARALTWACCPITATLEVSLTLRQGELLLQVKWKGYDDPADMTLEPEGNLCALRFCLYLCTNRTDPNDFVQRWCAGGGR